MKQYLKLILVILFPYFVVFALLFVFGISFMGEFMLTYIIESGVDVGIFLLATLFFLHFMALICSIVTFITSIVKKRDGRELLRLSMVIKLLQIPAYLFMFFAGLALFITIFTIPISFALFIFCCMTIFLTGLIGLGGIIRSFKENNLSITESVVYGFLQFIFCIDVISSIILYKKVKKRN